MIEKKAYRRSIWDERDEYKFQGGALSKEQLSIISTIQSIESAKKKNTSDTIKFRFRSLQ